VRRNDVPVAALTIAIALGAALAAPPARALTACSAGDIVSQDPGCPNTSAGCNVTRAFDVDDGCDLDFGARSVTITSQGVLRIADGAVTLEAGTLTIATGGFIDGRGNQTDLTFGGMIDITTSGAVTVQISGTATDGINVSGRDGAGTIDITSGGSVTIAGQLVADGLSSEGDGGTIRITATGNIQSLAKSTLSARAGRDAGDSGEFDLDADGRLDLGDAIDLSGPDGGTLNACAGQDVAVHAVDADAIGDGGAGGTVNIIGGTSVTTLGAIDARGSTSVDGFGGCGGGISIEADFGDLSFAEKVRAEGASPDGLGGEMDLSAAGSVMLTAAATVSARGNGNEGCGGSLSVTAGLDVTSAGLMDASGGYGGGMAEVDANRHVTLSGGLSAAGRAAGGAGGFVVVTAGDKGGGNLTISSTVDVSGGGCSSFGDCGSGGCADLEGCDVTVTSAGKVLSRASEGGENDLTAHEQITIQGTVSATKNTVDGTDGVNTVTYPRRKPENIGFGLVTPDPQLTRLDTCSMPNQQNCLVPCPQCGNGIVEFPETCDTAGTPVSCDGCSAFCQVESCDDGLVCTIDMCDPVLGCYSVPAPTPCVEPPTPTRTITSTPTVTSTPTTTPTPLPTAKPCIGDCNRNGKVSAEELVTGINITLGTTALNTCPLFDVNDNGVVTVDELTKAVSVALEGCPP